MNEEWFSIRTVYSCNLKISQALCYYLISVLWFTSGPITPTLNTDPEHTTNNALCVTCLTLAALQLCHHNTLTSYGELDNCRPAEDFLIPSLNTVPPPHLLSFGSLEDVSPSAWVKTDFCLFWTILRILRAEDLTGKFVFLLLFSRVQSVLGPR